MSLAANVPQTVSTSVTFIVTAIVTGRGDLPHWGLVPLTFGTVVG